MTPEIVLALSAVCFIIGIFAAAVYESDCVETQSLGTNHISKYIAAIFITASVGLLLWALTWSSIETEKYTSIESNEIIIEIEEKDTRSYIVNKCLYHDYYFYFGDNNRIEVSSKVYNEYSEGDKIVLNKETTYRYDPETDTTNIVCVDYDFIS